MDTQPLKLHVSGLDSGTVETEHDIGFVHAVNLVKQSVL